MIDNILIASLFAVVILFVFYKFTWWMFEGLLDALRYAAERLNGKPRE
jgi:hypothetical protein